MCKHLFGIGQNFIIVKQLFALQFIPCHIFDPVY